MKLAQEARNVQVSEGLATSQFKIKMDGKMFAMLSGKLYSDPIGAVIRELSTNAYDAQKDSGKGQEPFVVHLPNFMEPHFSVKDNGIGLSEEDIYKIYTTYGASNKTHTDELTGCLGLGSKSPFAYTDSFTAESRYNGVKTVYTCYVDEEQIPTIVKFSETPTEEPNGFEVIIPVEKSDISTFNQKAQEILRWFPTKPKVAGGYGNFQFSPREYIYQTEEYGVLKNTSYYGDQSKVIMGSVSYSLDASHLDCDKILSQIVKHGIDIFVDIGEVQFTPNREELIYDKKTIASIKSRLSKVKEEILKEVKEKIDAAPTRWEARKVLLEMNHPVVGNIFHNNNVLWKNESISTSWNLNSEIVDCRNRISNRDKDPNPIKDSEIVTLYHILKESNACKRKNAISISVNDKTVVFLFDMPRGNLSRIWWYLEQNRNKNAYAFENTEKARELLKEEGVPYILTSTLPVQPKDSKSADSDGKRTHMSKVNKYIPHTGGEYWEYWAGAKVDLEDGGIYVAISHYQYLLHYSQQNPDKALKQSPVLLKELLENLKVMGEGIDNLYGLRPADVSTVENHDEWISLLDYVKNVCKKHEKKMLKKLQLLKFFSDSNNSILDKMVQVRKEYAAESLINEYADFYFQVQEIKNDKQIQAFNKILKFIGQYSQEKEEDFVEQLVEKIKQEYPLITNLQYSYYSCNYDEFIDYVDAIDFMRGKKLPKAAEKKLVRQKKEAVAA